MEHTVDTAGRILGRNVVASVLSLPLLGEETGAGGTTVRRVRDAASGAIIEFALDAAGQVTGAHVVQLR